MDQEVFRDDIPAGEFRYFGQYFEQHHYDEYDGQTYIDRCAIYPDGSKIVMFGSMYEIKCSHSNTEMKNQTPTYSGDKVCADCGILLEKGITSVAENEYIPGLYLAGSNYTKLLYTWDELIAG
jgi:hypothetical protein